MYQFIHIEDYSINTSKKKRSDRVYNNEVEASDKKETNNVRGVIAEAKREQGNIPMSVKEVEEPVLLYGVDLDTVEILADEYHQKTRIKDKNGKEKKLRNDANVLIAGVISLNADCMDFWDDYKKESIKYLKEKYGDRLKSVIEHTDEPHPHFHFYVIGNPGERFELLHDGRRAMLENKDKVKRIQNRAYKQAMREFQEDFYSKVSFKFGLMKTGPKRKRTDKRSYHDAQREILLLNKLKKEADEEIKQLNKKVTTEKEKAFKIGFNKGLDQAVNEFNSNNALNKIIFSLSYRKREFLRYKNSSEHYKNEAIALNKRKNHYKGRLNEEITRNKENKNLFEKINKENETYKKINFFMNGDIKFNEEKENKDDYRQRIIEQISSIEAEQQRFSDNIKKVESRNNNNIREISRIGSKIERTFRILYGNLKNFIDDFFRIKFLERIFKEENNQEIKRFKFKEKTKEENNEFKKDRRLTIKWAIKKI